MLYKSLARSHLKYANSVWNPQRLGLIKDLEKVQMHATKLVISIKNLTSSRMCVINHNWSATKQRLLLQSVAEISCHSV